MINYNIKFLTSDESLHLKNGDFKSFKYETKKKSEESIYDVGKRTYCERRGGHWRAPRPRQMRQLESKLRDRTIVACEWTSQSLITLVFSSGAIAYLTVNIDTLDVTQILFDRYCVGKLSGQTVTGVVICQTHLMFIHADRMATLITYGKTAAHLPCRISDRDPHIQSIELGGGSRRTERRVSWCESNGGVRVLVWSSGTAEPAPWSPVMEDHANLHLYSITGQQMRLVAYHQLENETLAAELSSEPDIVIHIIDQITCHKNGVSLEWSQYSAEAASGALGAVAAACRARLPAPARCVRRARAAPRLLAACLDGSLHALHSAVGVTHSVRVGFIPSEVRWAGELVVAAEEGGRVQCFDRALTLLQHHAKCIHLAACLREARRTQVLAARAARGGPVLLAACAGGPLALLHISHPRLLTAWLGMGRAASAVSLLRAQCWAERGAECLWALNRLVCDALRGGPEAGAREALAQAALGAFLAPRAPLPAAAARAAPQVHDLARKFFHHLLRRGRIEKALSLGVELRAWDLCRDAAWAARGPPAQRALAREAAALADQFAPDGTDSECSESCSQCSSHSYSDGETSGSDVTKTQPPPLPRVSLPPHPHHSAWSTHDDTYLKITNHDKIKPTLPQGVRWHSIDNALNTRLGGLHTLTTISEVAKPAPTVVDIIPRAHDDRTTTSHFRSVYQTDLRDEGPTTIYRYHTNNNYHGTALGDRPQKYDATEKNGNRTTEKNKVKFSDTVTIAVVSDPGAAPRPPAPGAPGASGTPLDYVEV